MLFISLYILSLGIVFSLHAEEIDFGEPFDGIADVDYVHIYPKNGNFSSCKVLTELPKGLSIIAENCTILGFTHEVINLTKFSVISSQESRSLSGTFSLKISRCPYNAFDIVRTYGSSNVFFEVFVK